MAQVLKQRVELYLYSYRCTHPDISLTVGKTSTGVYKNDVFQMYIYYRKDAIRINVKAGTYQHGAYEALVADKLVFQKPSASPYSGKGLFAFFVDERNIETVIKKLLESETIPSDKLMIDYEINSRRYVEEKKREQSKT